MKVARRDDECGVKKVCERPLTPVKNELFFEQKKEVRHYV
jgi:hypothetical protein